MTGWLAIAGLGPGDPNLVTPEVTAALAEATDVIGYIPYVARVAPRDGLTLHPTDNRVELDRAAHALQLAAQGHRVVVVSSGDPGVFAMAAAVFEALEAGPQEWRDLDIRVLPGITAMLAASARAGAPLGHDFCAINLSDNLKPWPLIERRVRLAADADFAIAFYNPRSKTRIRAGAVRPRRLHARGNPPHLAPHRSPRGDGRHADDDHHRLQPDQDHRPPGRRDPLHAPVGTMIEPVQHVLGRMHLQPSGQGRPVYHDHAEREGTCRAQLRLRAGAAGVLADHELDPVRRHQPPVAVDIERPAIDHQMMPRQPGRLLWRIDEPQQILVLRLHRERIDMHSPQREHHAPRGASQRRDRTLDIAHAGPAITRAGHPGGARQGDVRHPRTRRSHDRIRAHSRRERMRRIDQMRHAVRPQMRDETLDTAKAAHPDRDRLHLGVRHAPGVAQHGRIASPGQHRSQRAGLGRAAQHQDVRHG
jgi:precorrin-3B C17-methyltransferase